MGDTKFRAFGSELGRFVHLAPTTTLWLVFVRPSLMIPISIVCFAVLLACCADGFAFLSGHLALICLRLDAAATAEPLAPDGEGLRDASFARIWWALGIVFALVRPTASTSAHY